MSYPRKQCSSFKLNNIIEGSFLVLILTSIYFIRSHGWYHAHTSFLFAMLTSSRIYTVINYVAGISFFFRIRKITRSSSIKIRYLGLVIGSVGLVLIVTIGNILAIGVSFAAW